VTPLEYPLENVARTAFQTLFRQTPSRKIQNRAHKAIQSKTIKINSITAPALKTFRPKVDVNKEVIPVFGFLIGHLVFR
jgi:hypothetical protein